MTSLLLCAVLAAANADAPANAEVTAAPEPRLESNVVEVGTGIFGAAYTATGARMGDTQWAVSARGRYLFGGLTGEAEVLALFPLTGNGAATSVALVPRIGWTAAHWTVVVGANVQLAPSAVPTASTVPSLRAHVRLTDGIGLSAGVFDYYGQVPFHLSAELGDYSVGWAAPLGLVASARWHLPAHLTLRVLGFVYRLYNQEAGMLSVGLSWGGAS